MVDTEDFVDKDIWAFWPDTLENLESLEESSLVHLVILQFRGGKLVGRIYRSADLEEALPDEDWMLGLLYQYYSKNPVPSQMIVPDALDAKKREALNELIVQSKKTVEEATEFQIHTNTQKKEWANLYELALENVKESHRVSSEAKRRQEDAHRELAELLEMPEIPVRLECVDISNFQGEENVASAVVFIRGKAAKEEYRRYIIKSVVGQDDFGSMREVMSRRYGKPGSPKPDLLVVDGGRGQLGAVGEILKALDCKFPVVGLAKARTESNFQSSEVETSEERFFIPGQKNPLKIRNRAVLKLITQLRDEAHRFAIEFHRERRDKSRLPEGK
jgi:excinuclease ABC subunit C